jgi:hypothetical protein
MLAGTSRYGPRLSEEPVNLNPREVDSEGRKVVGVLLWERIFLGALRGGWLMSIAHGFVGKLIEGLTGT